MNLSKINLFCFDFILSIFSDLKKLMFIINYNINEYLLRKLLMTLSNTSYCKLEKYFHKMYLSKIHIFLVNHKAHIIN